MACANCLHQDLLNEKNKIEKLKEKFSKLAKISGWAEYAIVKCSCSDGYSWRPIGHPDIKEFGAIEYCTT